MLVVGLVALRRSLLVAAPGARLLAALPLLALAGLTRRERPVRERARGDALVRSRRSAASRSAIRQTAIPISGFATSLALPPIVRAGGVALGLRDDGHRLPRRCGGRRSRAPRGPAPRRSGRRRRSAAAAPRPAHLAALGRQRAACSRRSSASSGSPCSSCTSSRGLSPGAAAAVLAVDAGARRSRRGSAPGRWSDVRRQPARARCARSRSRSSFFVAADGGAARRAARRARPGARRRRRALDELEQPVVRGRGRARGPRRSGAAIGLQQTLLNGAGRALSRRSSACSSARRRGRCGFARRRAVPARRLARPASIARMSTRARAARRDLRDRAASRRRLARGGRGARLAAGWMREAGLEVEVDAAGQHVRAPRRRARLGRLAPRHASRTAAASTARSASSPAIEAGRAARRAARRRRLPRRGARLRREQRRVAAGRLPDAYLELHVEQGPVLERADEPLGIVTAIAGQARGEVVFEGRADHAGTTPMDARDDALVDAAEFVLHVARRAVAGHRRDRRPHRGRARRGRTSFPRASPSRSTRAPATADELDALVAAIGFEPAYRAEPAAMSGAPLAALRAAAARRARARLRRRPRRDDPGRRRRADRRCSSSAA